MNPNIDIGGTSTPVGFQLGGSLGLGMDLDGQLLEKIGVNISLPVIHLDPVDLNANVAIGKILTESTLSTDSNLNTESKVDLNLKVAITELPKIKLEFGLDNMRIHLPTHYQFCFSLLGLEVFKFALCGESMVGIEPYVPHKTEKCG